MTIALPESFIPPVEGDVALAQLEREQFARLEFQRLSNLLRILLPIIAVLTILALPAAVYTDLQAQGGGLSIFKPTSSTMQVIIVFAGLIVSYLAYRRRDVTVAAFALFFGVSGFILLALLNGAVFSGTLALGAVPEFALLLVPIVLASVLGGPAVIVVTTGCTSVLTFVLLTFTPHDSAFLAFQHANAGGYMLSIVPISLQIVTGALIFISLNGARRAQLQLSTVRVAFERERELDRLKNQFIVNINHELRTPLMALQGYVVLAREFGHVNEQDQQEQMFDLGLETMHHVNALVESILDVRRIETDATPLKMVAVNLHDIILQATGMIDPSLAGGDRALHLHMPSTLRVIVDEERLRQVLINLIVNVCKYSPAGRADRDQREHDARHASGAAQARRSAYGADHG